MFLRVWRILPIGMTLMLSTVANSQSSLDSQNRQRFEAQCSSDYGKNVSYTLPTDQIRAGNTTNSGPSTFSIEAYQSLSVSGNIRWYLDFKFTDKNPNLFPDSINDFDAIITDDLFSISDTNNRDTIQMRRTYKNEWHGVHTLAVFQEKNKVRQEAFTVFVHPLKCKGGLKMLDQSK